MVELNEKGNFVREFASNGSQDAKRGRDRVAAALNRQSHDVFCVKIIRILGETRAAVMFDALIDGQDREIACATEPTLINNALQVAQYSITAIRPGKEPIHHVGAGQVQTFFGYFWLAKVEQRFGLFTEQMSDRCHSSISVFKFEF